MNRPGYRPWHRRQSAPALPDVAVWWHRPLLLSANLINLGADLGAMGAALNGVVAVPVMVMMMRLTMRPSVMAGFTLPLPLQVMGWLATATMTATVVAMVASWLKYPKLTCTRGNQSTAWMAAGVPRRLA